MKKYIPAVIVASSLALLCPSAFAQWDYGQDSTWNMIEHRAEMRRMQERMKARREAEKKQRAKTGNSRRGKGTSRKVVKSAAPAKKVALPVKAYGVWFYPDSFGSFHSSRYESGYRVNLNFVSTKTGKTFPRFAFYDTWHQDEDIWDVPAGTYTIQAEAIHKGKKYPVHLAIMQGSREKPPFETFAPSLKIKLKPIVTIGGKYVSDDDPLKLYVRMIG